jgi:putative ABC transport system substrate-binding protein
MSMKKINAHYHTIRFTIEVESIRVESLYTMTPYMRYRPNHAVRHSLWLLVIVIVALSACQPSTSSDTPPAIGVIIWLEGFEPAVDGLRDGLAELGYIEGDDYTLQFDGVLPDLDAVRQQTQAYIDADVDIIVSLSTPPTEIVKEMTAGTGIPVVFGATDPVATGLVASLERPDANLTGVATGYVEGYRLEWLLETDPDIEVVFLPYNPDDASAVASMRRVDEIVDRISITLLTVPVRDAEALQEALDTMPDDVDAIFTLADSLIGQQSPRLRQFALERRLPLSEAQSPPEHLGTLLAYAFTIYDAGDQMAEAIAQILQGVAPADIPITLVQAYLGVNLDTAEAIGVTLPDNILERADYIIEDGTLRTVIRD